MIQRIFFFVFGGIGVAFLTAAIFLFFSKKTFLDSAVQTTGTVIENIPHHSKKSTTYTPVVRFRTEDGRSIKFQGDVSSSPAAFDVSDKVLVYYAPQTPEKAQIGTFWQLWLLPMIFGMVGSVFFAIGVGFGIATYLHKKKIAYLNLSGQRIKVKVQSVQRDTMYKKNGRNPYRIYSQWINPYSNELHVFKSDAIWFDPSPYISSEIDVLIDPQNPKKYWVDISSLPKLA